MVLWYSAYQQVMLFKHPLSLLFPPPPYLWYYGTPFQMMLFKHQAIIIIPPFALPFLAFIACLYLPMVLLHHCDVCYQ